MLNLKSTKSNEKAIIYDLFPIIYIDFRTERVFLNFSNVYLVSRHKDYIKSTIILEGVIDNG